MIYGSDYKFRNLNGKTPKSVHWSIAWSDLMMTMFVLFLVIYVYKTSEQKARLGNDTETLEVSTRIEKNGKNIIQGRKSGMNEIPKETIRPMFLDEALSIELVKDKAVRIVLPGDLLFDTGKADLKAGARDALEKIANLIGSGEYNVNVAGHSDDVPIHSKKFATNWELSAIRSCIVARFLIEQMGLSEKRFYISAYAYNQPLFPNTSDENRRVNRRVEIILTKEIPYPKHGRAAF